ncbi:MAG TPA: ABC transporter ATP-binding protein [Anaerolineales bacterium]
MIELVDVSKHYHNTIALQNLNLQVEAGEIVGIIGHNGAGKSTILKIVAGLIEPTSGSVRVLGRDIQKESVTIKRQTGYLPEESPLYETMTARQYLLFFADLYRLPRARALRRIHDLLESLDLADTDKLTGEFSKGMKRKTAIARTLLHDPQLLILDEPNSGLDPLTSFFILNYLKALRSEGKTIFLSAHNLFHVETVCDRVAIIKNGRLLVFDRMDAIRARLGRREYQVVFQTDQRLAYERLNGSYVFRTAEVESIATMLEAISTNRWTLIDLSMKESALEEIYVKMMASGDPV